MHRMRGQPMPMMTKSLNLLVVHEVNALKTRLLKIGKVTT